MRFRRQRDPEGVNLIAHARELLGESPAVKVAADAPTDPAALNGLGMAVRAFLDDEDGEPLARDQLDAGEDLHTQLIVAKLQAQELTPDMIRGWTLAELGLHGLRTPPEHFPTILEAYAGPRRSLQEVLDRVRALGWVLHAAFGSPADETLEALTERGLLRWVSAQERTMLDTPDEEDADRLRIQIGWRTECLTALGWALGLYPTLPLDGLTEPAPEHFGPLDPDARAGVPADVTLRDERELMARLDVFYCAHWAVRDHQLTGLPAQWPEAIIGGAVWERRHALEWLLSADEWDDVDLGT
jgi:uncharacterized protein DUF4272